MLIIFKLPELSRSCTKRTSVQENSVYKEPCFKIKIKSEIKLFLTEQNLLNGLGKNNNILQMTHFNHTMIFFKFNRSFEKCCYFFPNKIKLNSEHLF